MQPTQTPDHTVVFSPADTLRGAAVYLRRHGWHQRDMFDLSAPTPAFPPACGLGGIRMALLGDAEIDADSWQPETVEQFDQAVMAFADHLFAYYGEPDPAASTPSLDPHCVGSWPEQIVADWNDAYDRNVSQVIAALNGAADQWDNRHGRPACCGQPMPEHANSPDVWVFPGEPVQVERIYHCPTCGRQENVAVTDPDAKAVLFSQAGCGTDGTPDQGGAE